MEEYKAGIEDLFKDTGDVDTNNYEIRKALEYFIEPFKRGDGVRREAINDVLIERHQFDFYSLLNAFGINEDLYWIVMRVNGLSSPTELRKGFSELIIPDTREIKMVLTTIKSSARMQARKTKR